MIKKYKYKMSDLDDDNKIVDLEDLDDNLLNNEKKGRRIRESRRKGDKR